MEDHDTYAMYGLIGGSFPTTEETLQDFVLCGYSIPTALTETAAPSTE